MGIFPPGTMIEGSSGALTAEQEAFRRANLYPGESFVRSEVGGLIVAPDGSTRPIGGGLPKGPGAVPYPDRVVIYVNEDGYTVGATTTARGLVLSYGTAEQRAASGVPVELVNAARRAEGSQPEPPPPMTVTAPTTPVVTASNATRNPPQGPVAVNAVSGVPTPILAVPSMAVLYAGNSGAPTAFNATPVRVPSSVDATLSPAYTPPASLVKDNNTAALPAVIAAPKVQNQKVPGWAWILLGLLALGSIA